MSSMAVIFVIISLFLVGCVQDEIKCRDGWCEYGETPESCPKDCITEEDFWEAVDIPVTTMYERMAYCDMSELEWQEYYEGQNRKAQELSDNLKDYIRGWLRGENPPEIPYGLLPKSINSIKTHSWTLQRPDETNTEEQWYFIPARKEPAPEFKALYSNGAATHVTYLKLLFIAPFDSKLLIEGDFPHSREMSYQIAPPFDPEFPTSHNIGMMEVPMIDVDIEPDLDHVNPFRTGANRNAENRHYHIRYDLKMGNAYDLNPVLQNPYFRAQGNHRIGGPFESAGPWGDGSFIPSVVWLRYYAPDLNPDGSVDPLAGVDYPKAILQLDTGEQFWIQPNKDVAEERQNTTTYARILPPFEPVGQFAYAGPSVGWKKIYNLLQIRLDSKAIRSHGLDASDDVKAKIRDQLSCLINQGPGQKPPGNIGHSATDHPYNNYLVRPLVLGREKVLVITGRLPKTPKTRNAESVMEGGTEYEARYWSICHHVDTPGNPSDFVSLVYGCLMDDEIITDENNDYIIVYSRVDDKPENAEASCGVTWQNFSQQSAKPVVIRWMDVYPDHYMEDYAPTDENIPWEKGAWSESEYDETLVGKNEPGIMGPFHPVVHYMSREEFEALGCPLDAGSIPEWTK